MRSPTKKDLETYKTIPVPMWVYANAKEAELAILRKGFDRLPQTVLQPKSCPICKSELTQAQTDDENPKSYLTCLHCGYTQPKFEGSTEGIALGTTIGMGLVHLLNTLFGSGTQPTEVGPG
ncbi:MAG: hypothetical protein RMJ90_02775 [Candidatus Bipolaricaulota bacterium]|nr:hypothetical protein [Candidatus Bipolaricaulota bacterium]